MYTNKTWLHKLNKANKEECTEIVQRIKSDCERIGEKLEKVITDNGRQFIGDTWKIGVEDTGTKPFFVSPHNPQSSTVVRTMREISMKLRLKINKENASQKDA